MLSHVSQKLSGHFAAGLFDWTPVDARNFARMVYMPLTSDAEVTGMCASTLSAVEVQRSARFSAGSDRMHFNQRRAFRRYCGAIATGSHRPMAEINFSETKNGRPFLAGCPDVAFSFSSCQHGFLGAWSSTHGVGADVESKTRQVDLNALAHQYFSTAEAAVVEGMQGQDRTRAFYQIWTLKEAALKCIGEGLPYGLDQFGFDLAPELQMLKAPEEHGGPDQFFASVIEKGDRCAALVIRHPDA